MKTFGIVCELNPLHNGHKRLVDEAKHRGAECVVCVMSGNAVQRGELAICDKYIRAEAAVRSGADLVLELPYPWSAASAEHFSRAAIYILSHMCDCVIFGSECGDIELLRKAATAASTTRFREEYRARLEAGEGAAAAYFSLLKERGADKLGSNDILGIEYIRAAIDMKINMDFLTLKREGDSYNSRSLGANCCPSATSLRAAWQTGSFQTESYMPKEAAEVFARAIENREITDERRLERAILMYFRLADPKSFESIAEAEGGIGNRICTGAKESKSIEELYEGLKTKRYTDAKLRRAMLFAMTGVNRELLLQVPEYTTLLGAGERGRELLSRLRKENGLNIVTKPADAPRESIQLSAEEKLEAIFTLAKENTEELAHSYRKKAFIL